LDFEQEAVNGFIVDGVCRWLGLEGRIICLFLSDVVLEKQAGALPSSHNKGYEVGVSRYISKTS